VERGNESKNSSVDSLVLRICGKKAEKQQKTACLRIMFAFLKSRDHVIHDRLPLIELDDCAPVPRTRISEFCFL